ncbi:CU044_2847 family protein [Streptomyces sp. ODS28]|uniref:CU044_2847 family protein n=1 Tax=Streptomyces sp. ODS28 TaxID=3136688 RepID=UPI0031EFA5C9
MAYRVREIDLGDGEVVLARVESLDAEELALAHGPAEYGQGQDVGALDGVVARAGEMRQVIAHVGRSVVAAARQAGPDEVAVTFGLELAAKSGKAVAFLADAEAKGSLSVTLTWYADEHRARDRADSDRSDTDGGHAGADRDRPADGRRADERPAGERPTDDRPGRGGGRE